MISDQREFAWESAAASARSGRPSQSELILDRLARTPGVWVPMPELAQASRSYAVHSRVSDLRRAAYLIEHRNRWFQGVCCSEYRLILP